MAGRKHDQRGRSTGRALQRQTIEGQFAPRLIEMLESPAYRALSLAAHAILARLEIEMAHHGGKDNGQLPATYDQFMEYGIHRNSIAPALREVVALGFVEITEKGKAGKAVNRRPSLYRLTYRHTDGAKGEPTNEWRKFDDLEMAKAAAAAARKASIKKIPSIGKRTMHQYRNPYGADPSL